jgi:hypothetical protein
MGLDSNRGGSHRHRAERSDRQCSVVSAPQHPCNTRLCSHSSPQPGPVPSNSSFRLALEESLVSCSLMIVLIGKDWLAKNEAGQVRLDNPDDWVRLEVGTALKRNIPVTPVLVRGARMPRAEELPEELKGLSYRNGFELSHNRWNSDVQELIKRLGLRPTSPPKGPSTNKRLLAVVAGACVFAIAVGRQKLAGNCTTTCQWIGRQQFCNTHCF